MLVGLIHPTTAIVTLVPAPITSTMGPAISTKRTSELLARVLLAGLSYPLTTAIRRTVPVTNSTDPVTSTNSTSVVLAIALELDHQTITATTLLAPIIPIAVPANKNSNNNNNDNVYGAVIVAKLLREFTRFI